MVFWLQTSLTLPSTIAVFKRVSYWLITRHVIWETNHNIVYKLLRVASVCTTVLTIRDYVRTAFHFVRTMSLIGQIVVSPFAMYWSIILLCFYIMYSFNGYWNLGVGLSHPRNIPFTSVSGRLLHSTFILHKFKMCVK